VNVNEVWLGCMWRGVGVCDEMWVLMRWDVGVGVWYVCVSICGRLWVYVDGCGY
jgi:hypothetical protein